MFNVSSCIDLLLSLFLAIHVCFCWYMARKDSQRAKMVIAHPFRNALAMSALQIVIPLWIFFSVIYALILWRFSVFLFHIGAQGASAYLLIGFASMFAIFRLLQSLMYRQLIVEATKEKIFG